MFSVLYDLDLLPEQVKEGSFQEWKMFSVLSHFKDMDAHYLPQIQQLKQEVEDLMSHLKSSCDPFNGNKPQWCGVCGYPMEAVRPGKVQCNHCESIDSLESQLLEANKRIEELKMGSYATSSPNTITVNLRYHNGLLDRIKELEHQLLFIKSATCFIHPFSSRTCEFGTHSCNTMHIVKFKYPVPTTEANSIKP